MSLNPVLAPVVLAVALALTPILTHSAWAMPAQIILIRHAEKPKSGNELSERGFERAQAIPHLLLNDHRLMKYGSPVAVYAADQKGPDTSLRMIQTVTPLARQLGLEVQHPFPRKEYKALREEIETHSEYSGKTVVICWQSDSLPKLLKALGFKQGPSEWPEGEFDRAWVIQYSGNEVISFDDMPQRLLPGDSEE